MDSCCVTDVNTGQVALAFFFSILFFFSTHLLHHWLSITCVFLFLIQSLQILMCVFSLQPLLLQNWLKSCPFFQPPFFTACNMTCYFIQLSCYKFAAFNFQLISSFGFSIEFPAKSPSLSGMFPLISHSKSLKFPRLKYLSACQKDNKNNQCNTPQSSWSQDDLKILFFPRKFRRLPTLCFKLWLMEPK